MLLMGELAVCWSYLEKGGSFECGCKAVNTALNGAIEHIIADADAETAKYGGIHDIVERKITTISGGYIFRNAVAVGRRKFRSAFHGHRAALDLKTGEAMEGSQDGAEIPRLVLGDPGEHDAQFRVIQPPIGLAHAEQAASAGGGDFGNFHGLGLKRIGLGFDS